MFKPTHLCDRQSLTDKHHCTFCSLVGGSHWWETIMSLIILYTTTYRHQCYKLNFVHILSFVVLHWTHFIGKLYWKWVQDCTLSPKRGTLYFVCQKNCILYDVTIDVTNYVYLVPSMKRTIVQSSWLLLSDLWSQPNINDILLSEGWPLIARES